MTTCAQASGQGNPRRARGAVIGLLRRPVPAILFAEADLSERRSVLVVLVDRANYGRLKPVMRAIAEHPDLELRVACAGTMVLERFDQPVRIVREDGFPVDAEIYLELEGSSPLTMAKSLGFAMIEFSGEFQRSKPDVVLIIGDRYEALAAAIAAAYMNIPVFHMQGGEVSGSIDESARHAITKFAHFHFPATERAASSWYAGVSGRTHPWGWAVRAVTSPSRSIPGSRMRSSTDGARVPTSTCAGPSCSCSSPTNHGVRRWARRCRSCWKHRCPRAPPAPAVANIDAGADHISKTIRTFRVSRGQTWLRTLTNLTPENYLKVLANDGVCVGNSSSFVRDASSSAPGGGAGGQPAGGAETAAHVTGVPPQRPAIVDAVHTAVGHGRYYAQHPVR